MAEKYMVGTENVVEIAEIQMKYIEQCYNEWGWLDDTSVDLTEYLVENSMNKNIAEEIADSVKRTIRNTLEQKGIIGFEEHRPESEGGDLYYICSEYEYLFAVA